MGAPASDGRLDLDELGSVIEGATPAAADTVDDGLARPSLAERLEDVGVLPWMRRHRPLVVALTAAGIAGVVGLAVHQATQPPPLDPRVTAALTPLPIAEGGWGAPSPDRSIVVGRMLVTGVTPGETVAVAGLSGPGLGATSAAPLDGSQPGTYPDPDPRAMPWTTSATIDCASPRSLTAQPSDYAVLLERTDRWGRTVTGALPLPEQAEAWADTVRRTCWQRTVAAGVALDSLEVRTDVARGTVALGVVIRNDAPLDLLTGSAPSDLDKQGVRIGQSFRVNLPAGLGAQTEVLMTVTSCDRAAVPLVGVLQWPDGGTEALVPGITADVASPDRRLWSTVPLVFDAEEARAVGDAVAAVCAGAPALSLTPVGAPVVQALGGPTDERQMRFRLALRPSSGAVSAVDVAGDAGLPAAFSARSLPDPDGTVEAVWRFTCANTPAPPTVSMTLTDGERTWPWRAAIDAEPLARAVLRSCPTATDVALASTGWPARVLVRG
jgi:hypothetical protein